MTQQLERRAPGAAPGPIRPAPLAPVLFSTTAFVGAGLLFVVQPMVARMLLPSFGGAATVWATSSLFFQVLLLVAYLYVHASARLGSARQPWLHLPLLLVPLLVLPIALPSDAAPSGSDSPIVWLLRALVLMIGLPFAVVATTGPVLQRWYSWTGSPRADDPYFLYAASNVGSFVGLLAYPFLVEPHLTLAAQRQAWSIGFVLFAVLTGTCAAYALRQRTHMQPEAATTASRVSAGRVARWLALSFLPSSLLLGVTTHLTTDVASIPLLWVVPLAIYLATFVGAFLRTTRKPPVIATYLAVLSVVACVGVNLVGSPPILVPVVLNLVMLAAVAYAAHARLAADRPEASNLTFYYVIISVGGALGGLLNGFIAPLVLDRVLEYPLTVACVPMLLLGLRQSRRLTTVLAAVLAVLVAGAFTVDDARRAGDVIERTRTFYGSYFIADKTDLRRFVHGTTLHGFQYKDERASEPTSYYARSGPLGDVFELGGDRFRDITVVGLGAGTVAAYGQDGQSMQYVEIDPEVIRIAEDERLFTYLSDSAAEIATVAGDGRLEVAKLPEASVDLMVLDAFSSDAIPIHLLTEEAMRTYASRLRPGGVLAVHISNRVFDLEPVMAGAARALGWRAIIGNGGWDEQKLAVPSTWVVLSSDDALLDRFDERPMWWPVDDKRRVSWTDDYSSLLDVLQ